jgi:hypothetical protein
MIQIAIILSKRLCEPRAAHAERVANLLGNASEVEISAAYLHDIIEDRAMDEDELLEIMGEEVTDIVLELTDTSFSKIREYEYLRWASHSAKRIKLADRIDNIKKRMTSNHVMYYALESERLLGVLKGTDRCLECILRSFVVELKARCAKYPHENLLGKFGSA